MVSTGPLLKADIQDAPPGSMVAANVKHKIDVQAWARGDLDAFEAVALDDMETESPALHRALLVERNTDWANQIQTMLEGSGTVFIAVGAAHLAGDDSVQEILEDRGVAVTRE